MSSPLEIQAKAWVETISSEETLSSYQAVAQTLITAVKALWDAIKVTWNIIKETGKLLWLFVCFGLVASDWLWDSGTRLVEKAKGLTSDVGDPKSETYFADAGKALLEASKTGAVKAVSQAREQLGLPKNERSVATQAPAPKPAPKAAPTPKTASAPQAKPKSKPVAVETVEEAEA